jgi:hypothetical protein
LERVYVTIPEFVRRDWGKQREPSVRIAFSEEESRELPLG